MEVIANQSKKIQTLQVSSMSVAVPMYYERMQQDAYEGNKTLRFPHHIFL